jgi:hypothetical protein
VETGGKQLTEGSENKDPRVIIKDGDDFSELSSEQGDSGNSI